jgi:ribosomal protein S4E
MLKLVDNSREAKRSFTRQGAGDERTRRITTAGWHFDVISIPLLDQQYRMLKDAEESST